MQIRYMVKRCKYKVCTREQLVCNCEVNQSDPNNFKYSGYDIGFNTYSNISIMVDGIKLLFLL